MPILCSGGDVVIILYGSVISSVLNGGWARRGQTQAIKRQETFRLAL